MCCVGLVDSRKRRKYYKIALYKKKMNAGNGGKIVCFSSKEIED